MLKTKLKNQKGFTIIEVLIVLAIAGLIMLIVFLAVPALQRNNRNTQRNNDVSAMLGGVNEFVANNSNKLPTAITAGTATDFKFASGTSAAPTGNQVMVRLGFYDASGTNVTIGTGAFTNPADESTVAIRTGAKCDPTTFNAVAGNTRQVAVVYTTETGAKQCRDS